MPPSNHWSRPPKPQARYRISRSCHCHYPSLPLKLSLSTSLTISVLFEEGKIFFVMIFVSFCVYILRFSIIIFVWILGKCEKLDNNVFSRALSRIQPNTRKYFPKYFLECNQTPENIFFFEKYFHLKIFYTRKTIYIEPNIALLLYTLSIL